MKIILVLSLFCIASLGAYDFSDFDAHQEKWTRPEIEKRLKLFLQKDEKIAEYFSISDDLLTLYDSPVSQSERGVDFCLRLISKAKEQEKKVEKKKSLIGMKVAIDPGHLGGKYARLEERFIDIPPSLERKEVIRFDEGTLSLLTAKYLKLLLEKEGAEVMLTRTEIAQGVYEKDFFSYLKDSPELWWGETPLSELFRKHYNPLDLRARAEKINAFSPDLSIVIHYNSAEATDGARSNHGVTASNYNMVFIPGAFCHGELAKSESRHEFIRLLVTEDLPQSLSLSRSILSEFVSHLAVPIVSSNDKARYLDSVCLKLDEGVYARNLGLTRLIHGPVCYGETLIQNNIYECQNLNL